MKSFIILNQKLIGCISPQYAEYIDMLSPLFKLRTLFSAILLFITCSDSTFAQWNVEPIHRFHSNGMVMVSHPLFEHDFSLHRSRISQPKVSKVATTSSSIRFHAVPGPNGGTVRSILTAKTGWMLVSTDGGVYRSSDNGAHWEHSLFPTQMYNFVEPLLELAPDLIAAQTDFSSFLSRDNGATWSYLPYSFRGFAVDSAGSVFAGSEGNGIYVSTDAAKSWKQFALKDKNIYRVILDVNGTMVCAADSGLYYSADRGVNWTFRKYPMQYVWNLTGDAKGHLFSIQNDSLARSDDYGITWTRLPSVTATGVGTPYRVYPGLDGKLFVICSYGILYSTDFGTNVTKVSFPYDWPLTIGTDLNGSLVAGSFHGITRRDPVTQQWTDINEGIHSLRINSVDFTPKGTMFAVSIDRCFRSTDDGNSWKEVTFGPAGMYYVLYPMIVSSSGTVMLSAFANGLPGILRSTDDGSSWTHTPISSTDERVVSISEGVNKTLMLGTYSGTMYRSTDDGMRWDKIYSGTSKEEISAIAGDTSGNWYALQDSVVIRYTNTGQWKYSVIPKSYFNTYAAVAVESNGRIFISTPWGGVKMSDDQGETWNPTMSEVYNPFVMSLATDNNGNVFAGTGNGFYRLADSVLRWDNINDGFPSTFTLMAKLSPEGYLYGGTQDYGMYVTETPVPKRYKEIPQPKIVTDYALKQNYPNPFNGGTTIEYEILLNSTVEISVFDLLGRKIAELVHRELPSGTYSVSWDPGQSAGGVYFIRMNARAGAMIYSTSVVKALYVR